MATKTKKSDKPTVTKAVAKVEVAFTASESKVIAALAVFGTEATQTINRLEKLGGLFQRAYTALATLPKEKWDTALIQAKVPATSSHYSSLKRAALDPKAADKALETAGTVHGAVKLLPHQPTKSGKKVGRKAKTAEEKLADQGKKAVKFLCENYEEEDIHTWIKKEYSKHNKAASEKEVEA